MCSIPWRPKSDARFRENHRFASPLANALSNALAKWEAGAAGEPPETPILAADTVLDLAGETIGKPAGAAEARDLLRRLSGRAHDVVTAVARGRQGAAPTLQSCRTRVVFRPLDEAAIEAYLALVDPLDKAGAYGIQEHGELLIERIDGSLTNVIGLPLEIVLPWCASVLPGTIAPPPPLRLPWLPAAPR